MKRRWKRWCIVGVLLAFFFLAVTGCSAEKRERIEEEESIDPLYPVTIDDSEILIGETTIQTLLDKGFQVTFSEMSEDYEITTYEVDPEMELEGNAYYTGGTVRITDGISINISLVTDAGINKMKDAGNIKMKDAVIAYMDFSLIYEHDESELERISFNGIPLTELSREKAGEVFPDFTGDESMWFSPASMSDYDYFMGFDNDGRLTRFSVEKEYDVDWSREN